MAIGSSFSFRIPNSGAELAGQPLMERGTARVEPDERDGGAMVAVFGFDRVQCRDTRGVPDLGMREIDQDALRVLAVRKTLDEVVAAAEEQRPMDVVADRKAVLGKRAVRADDMRDAAREQHHCQQHPDGDPDFSIWSWEVAPDGIGSRVRVTWDLNPKQFLNRMFFAPLRARGLPRDVAASLTSLEKFVTTLEHAR